jgi:hypothetical protein
MVAFVVGAGASADFGAPTMGSFLSAAEQEAQHDGQVRGELEAVMDWREKAVTRHALLEGPQAGSGAPDADNLEDMFCLLDMEASFFHSGLRDTVSALARLIGRVYVRSIGKKLQCALRRLWVGGKPVLGYEKLLPRLRSLGNGQLWQRGCTFITTNYDCALDTVVAHIPAFGLDAVYGHPGWTSRDAEQIRVGRLAWWPLYWLGRATDAGMASRVPKLLKLHGSVNWGTCTDPDCDAPVQQFPIFGRKGSEVPFPLDAVAKMSQSHCEYHPAHDEEKCIHRPLIVPPSWKRQQHNYALRRIWVRAHRDLGCASRIVIVGHSLAPTDSYLRDFLALSLTRNPDNRVLLISHEGPGLGRYAAFLQSIVPGRWDKRAASFSCCIDDILSFVEDVV